MIRILFIDDEINTLRSLKRVFHNMRREWVMRFAETAQDGLDILLKDEFDVLVTDLNMPDISGIELLNIVKDKYPTLIRIVLTGQVDQQTSYDLASISHQTLAKPFEPQVLLESINQTTRLNSLLMSDKLKALVGKLIYLPSPTDIYIEITDLLNGQEYTLQDIAKIIEKDVALTAMLLKIATSPLFARHTKHASVLDAVKTLGIDIIKSLVISNTISNHTETDRPHGLNIDDFMQHSLLVSKLSKQVYLSLNDDPIQANYSSMAGMLHDIGQLIFWTNLKDQYQELCSNTLQIKMDLWQAEQSNLGGTHASVGAYLLGLWGIPEPVVNAVAFHHSPEEINDVNPTPAAAVYIANKLVISEGNFTVDQDSGFLLKFNVENHITEWQDLYLNLTDLNIL